MAKSYVSPLLKLPNELLLQVAKNVMGDVTDIIRNEAWNARASFVERASGLRGFALSCRRLQPIAEKVLYEGAVLGDVKHMGMPCLTAAYHTGDLPMVQLARTFIERPDLREHIRHLQIVVLYRSNIEEDPRRQRHFQCATNHGTVLLEEFLRIVDTSPFGKDIKSEWKLALERGSDHPVCGILLALIPKLESLSLITHAPKATFSVFRDMFGLHYARSNSHTLVFPQDYPEIDRLAALSDLKYLRLRGLAPPVGASRLQNLDTMDLWSDVPWHDFDPYVVSDTRVLHNVRTLRLRYCFLYLDLIFSNAADWYNRFADILKNFPHLRHLQLVDTDPLARREFPAQHDLDLAEIVKVIQRICPELTSLDIPDGSFLPLSQALEFRTFTKLEQLSIPLVNVVLEWAEQATLSPGGAFPSSLRRLRLTGSRDGALVERAKEIFQPGGENFPMLEELDVE